MFYYHQGFVFLYIAVLYFFNLSLFLLFLGSFLNATKKV